MLELTHGNEQPAINDSLPHKQLFLISIIDPCYGNILKGLAFIFLMTSVNVFSTKLKNTCTLSSTIACIVKRTSNPQLLCTKRNNIGKRKRNYNTLLSKKLKDISFSNEKNIR